MHLPNARAFACAHVHYARSVSHAARAPSPAGAAKTDANTRIRNSPNSAFAMSFGDFSPACSVCGHVPKYWRFHGPLSRAGVGLLQLDRENDGVAPELEEGRND